MTDNNNLPALANGGGDVALAGEGDGITHALERLVANLHGRVEAFDDIDITLDVNRSADGSSRSVFHYRCYKHRS